MGQLLYSEPLLADAWTEETQSRLFTVSGTFVFPNDATNITATIVGAGAGGSGGNYHNNWLNSLGGGAAGGYASKGYGSTLAGLEVRIVIGQGTAGTPGVIGGGTALPAQGGTTSFYDIYATGGTCGQGYTNWGNGGSVGIGGIGYNGAINYRGNEGNRERVQSAYNPLGGVGWAIQGNVYGSGGYGGYSTGAGGNGLAGVCLVSYNVKKMKGK